MSNIDKIAANAERLRTALHVAKANLTAAKEKLKKDYKINSVKQAREFLAESEKTVASKQAKMKKLEDKAFKLIEEMDS